MKIYMVEYHFYEDSDVVGYFLEESKAEECCKYLSRTDESRWYVCEYDLDETDYESLNKAIDEEERLEFESRLAREKQAAIAEITRLKEKYGL